MAGYGAPWRDSSPADFRTAEEAIKAAYERELFLRTAVESPSARPTPDPFREELEALYRLHAAKRSDYTADSGDILANYRFSASMMGVPIERGMFGRMCEKVFRLKSLFEKGTAPKVTDETAADTLRDIAIIAILMRIEMLNGEAK